MYVCIYIYTSYMYVYINLYMYSIHIHIFFVFVFPHASTRKSSYLPWDLSWRLPPTNAASRFHDTIRKRKQLSTHGLLRGPVSDAVLVASSLWIQVPIKIRHFKAIITIPNVLWISKGLGHPEEKQGSLLSGAQLLV